MTGRRAPPRNAPIKPAIDLGFLTPSTTTAFTRPISRATPLGALGGRVVLHFLAPYCPDANRIERVWQDFHANVTRNHRCTTMTKLLANARRYLDSYRWCRSVTASVARAAA